LNIKYMFVTLDVSKLIGWLKACALCRVEGRGRRCGARCAPGGGTREGVGRRRRKRHARGRPDSGLAGQGTRGAHVEHGNHVRDLGGVKAQRLVEGVRVLPSRREGHAMWGEVRAGRPEGVRRRRRKRHARRRPDSKLRGQGTRGAHVEHAVHVRNHGGVEAQRLVVRRRLLPSRREGQAMRGEVRAGRREGVRRWRRKRGMHGEGPTQGLEAAGHARSARRTCRTCS